MSGISCVPYPSKIPGDLGLGYCGFALAISLVSPSPSLKLQAFPLPKDCKVGYVYFGSSVQFLQFSYEPRHEL